LSGQILAQVAERVLLPLLAGGPLHPLPPIGATRARAAAESASFATDVLGEVRVRRLRNARRLCAADALGDPGPAEWLMACALNDLLQSTNPSLLGPFASDRPAKLLAMVDDMLAAAGPPRTIGEALGRHATFSRLLELVRIDTHLSFWVGRQVYRGVKPPRRVTRWRKVRRVSEREERVALTEMLPANPVATPLFESALRMLLAASPLTDLANAAREAPKFAWTGAALSLVATPPGRTLALRVLERTRAPRAAHKALSELPDAVRRGVTPEAAQAGFAVAELLANLEQRLTAVAERA